MQIPTGWVVSAEMLGGEIWEHSHFLCLFSFCLFLFCLFFVSALVASLAPFALLALSFSSSPELTFLQAFFQHAPSKPTQCLFTNQLWFSQDKILQIHTNLWKTAITIDPLLPRTSLQFFHFKKITCLHIFPALSFLFTFLPRAYSSLCSFILP